MLQRLEYQVEVEVEVEQVPVGLLLALLPIDQEMEVMEFIRSHLVEQCLVYLHYLAQHILLLLIFRMAIIILQEVEVEVDMRQAHAIIHWGVWVVEAEEVTVQVHKYLMQEKIILVVEVVLGQQEQLQMNMVQLEALA